jgi:acyl-CoA thioesterase-1
VGAATWLLRRVPALRRSLDQVPAHALAWRLANARYLEATARPAGPLWVVLGDSTAQGIGVADPQEGYVGRVRRLLEQRDGTAWQVVNLSRSGAVVRDLLDTQLPAIEALGLQPDLVTAVVGGNDLRRTDLAQLLSDLRDLLTRLPAGSVVATMPRGLKQAKAVAANAELLRLAAARGLPVADLWSHTGPPWRGKYADGLHPNAVGLDEWVAALAEALGLPGEALT